MTAIPTDPTAFNDPVWYEPLRSPSWILPELRHDALKVRFVPGRVPSGLSQEAREVRLGLPMALAEAARFTTDVATVSALRAAPADVLVTVTVDEPGTGRTASVRMRREDGSEIEPIERGGDDPASAGAGFAELPGVVAAALREMGARAQWSTLYRAPAAQAAVAYARSHRLVALLRDPSAHRLDGTTVAEVAEARATLKGTLTALAEMAGRAGSPMAALLFFAGLFLVHDGGSGLHTEFRLATNGICEQAKDPHDPVFRLSVPALHMIGDVRESDARRQLVGRDADIELRRWLLRTAV
jgi:hypothetical protein